MDIKNLKVLTFIIFCVIFLIKCFPGFYRYDPDLYRYKCTFYMNDSPNLIYSDSLIEITFLINPNKSEFAFELENKTDKPIKINWDDLSYVTPRGRTSRVIHTGIRYIEKDKPQAPTTIPPKAKLLDALTPSVFIYWGTDEIDILLDRFGSWKVAPLFYGYKKEELEGKNVSIYFPMEIGGIRKEYTFTFKIVKAE